MKKIISTQNAPGAIGPYSQAVKIGNMIYTSGQIPLNPQTSELVEDIKKATRQCLENLKAILESEGADMSDIIKTTVFLKDMNDFIDMNEVYAEYFQENPPARSTVQVAALPKGSIVEIEAIASVEK